MKTRRYTLGAVTLTAVLLVGCGAAGDTAADDDGPIKVAVVYGMTGAYAGTGEIAMTGLQAAADTFNAEGGVDGRPFEVTILDSRSDPTHAVTVLGDLLDSDDRPHVVVPGGNSPEVLALLPMVTDEELFGVSVATSPESNDPDLYPYYFGVSPTNDDQLMPIVAEWEETGVESIGVVLGADALGDAWMGAVERIAEASGIEIVAVERPDIGALNFDVELQRISAESPDAIFSDFPVHDAIARLMTSRLTVGAEDIPLYAATGTSASYPASLLDEDALQNCSMVAFDYAVQKPDQPEYLAPLYEHFVGEDLSIYSAGLGWDVLHVIALAVERSGGALDGESLAEALASEPVPADYLALYSTGTTYTADNHFPTALPGSMTLVPCGSTQADSLWVVDE